VLLACIVAYYTRGERGRYYQKGGGTACPITAGVIHMGSILCEMQGQKGNEGYQEYNHEKWEAGNSRGVPGMWD